MKPFTALLIAGVALAQTPQEGEAGTPPATEPAAEEPASTAVDAEALRQRIRKMRMNLLLGGDQVRAAENEARQFYGGKMESVDARLDTLESDLAEKRPGYELALDRALSAEDPVERQAAMREASRLRAEISSIEREAAELGERRNGLSQLVGAIEDRDRERERLVAQIESSSAVDETFSLPLATIGLAPPVNAEPAASPLDDEALVRDLLGRDPIGGRGVLFEMDPTGYWRRFPLRPPGDRLRSALQFPLPDLPGSR